MAKAKPTAVPAPVRKKAEGPTGKVGGRFKQAQKIVACVRVPEHKAFPVDFRPETGRPIKAWACDKCGVVWRFTTFRWQGTYTVLATSVVFPGGGRL